MSTDKATPREWYLNFATTLGTMVRTPSQFNQSEFPRSPDFQAEAIHVIEAAPVLAELEALRLRQADDERHILNAHKHIAKLESENAALKESCKSAYEELERWKTKLAACGAYAQHPTKENLDIDEKFKSASFEKVVELADKLSQAEARLKKAVEHLDLTYHALKCNAHAKHKYGYCITCDALEDGKNWREDVAAIGEKKEGGNG